MKYTHSTQCITLLKFKLEMSRYGVLLRTFCVRLARGGARSCRIPNFYSSNSKNKLVVKCVLVFGYEWFIFSMISSFFTAFAIAIENFAIRPFRQIHFLHFFFFAFVTLNRKLTSLVKDAAADRFFSTTKRKYSILLKQGPIWRIHPIENS